MNHLQWLLACLRAQYWNYQESHWQIVGPSYYGDHLLFERLYKSVVDEVDQLAEKMVAQFGVDSVNGLVLQSKMQRWLEVWHQAPDLHQRGLHSEIQFLDCCKKTYDRLKNSGMLSLGMDDFLMSISSAHETNKYLLQQVLRT